MAILKNLIVNGASRFLQKAYFGDIAVSGTTTISTLNATTLTASGTSTFNGGVKFNNAVGIYKTGSAYPALNFHYTNSGVTSYIQEYPAGTLNISSNLAVTSGSTTLNTLVVNNTSNFGDKVKVDGDVDIIGNLRWSTIAEHMTIQNLGGTLLVAPTIYQSNNTTINVTSKTNNSVKFTITDSSMITGTTVDTTNNTFISGGANWRKNSLVKVSGKIGECVLGASDGEIESINVSNYQMTITATIANAADIEVRSYSASEISDFAVMLYKLHNGTNLFPIGIVLTSYGSDRKSYIDVYGGMNANPVARMGNLGGLTYKDYSSDDSGTDTTLANQWGFYAKGDAYFEGKLETNSGKIGGWVITSTGLKKGGALGSANSIHLIPAGATTATSIGGSTNTNLKWTITSGNTFGVTTGGSMYCSAGKIGGWNITETQLFKGLFGDPDNASVYLIPAGSTITANIGGYGDNITGWVITSRNTFGVNTDGGMYCTYGKIGGWTIDADSIFSGTKTSASSVRLSTVDFNRTINGTSRSNLRMAFGSNFGVDSTGILYANDAYVSGTITASDGKIGGWNIGEYWLFSTTDEYLPFGADGTFYLSPPDYSGAYTSINGSGTMGPWCITVGSNFGVFNTGAMYCSLGKIGAMLFDSKGIYTGDPSSTSDTGIYFGSANIQRTIKGNVLSELNFAIGQNFGVNASGEVYADSFKYYDSSSNLFTAIGRRGVAKDTTYNLVNNHLYLLITWHNTSYQNKGVWLFRAGYTDFIKVNTYHNNTTSVSGANVTVTLTTTTVEFTSSQSVIGRLIDLG